MIDFRYHLVSLISVFLALAVGIILGAGPLKEAIGDQLTGQVTQLRAEKAEMRTSLTEQENRTAGAEELLQTNSSLLLHGSLKERRIGIVTLAGADDKATADAVTAIESDLLAAGATTNSHVTVNESWFAEKTADSRQSYASSLVEYLPASFADAGYDAVLAQAFVVAFSGYSSATAVTFASNADLIREILINAELVSVKTPPNGPVDAYILVVPKTPETASTAPTTPATGAPNFAIFANALASSSEGAVAVGLDALPNGYLDAVRTDDSAQASTVPDIQGTAGQLSAVIALNAQIRGTIGQYSPVDKSPVLPQLGSISDPNRKPLAILAGASSD